MNEKYLYETLEKAVKYRQIDALENFECLRLSAGASDGLEGVIVDKFGTLVVASIYNSNFRPFREHLGNCLANLFPTCEILVKARVPGEKTSEGGYDLLSYPSHGVEECRVSKENNLSFEIHADMKHDFGIYLDAAVARQCVGKWAKDLRVLNLFSYTCAFAIVAMAKGAKSVTNVDPSREYLTWGKRNGALNGCDFSVIPDTAQAFLRREKRRFLEGKEPRFDMFVIDPPAFGVGRGKERMLSLLWDEFFESILLLKPKNVLLMCNDRVFREKYHFYELLQKKLGSSYFVEEISQSAAVLGAHPQVLDPFYRPPEVAFLHKK